MRISDWSSDVCSSDLARSDRKVPIAADAVASDETRLRVADPHRWDGLADPYLYRILAEVRDAKGRLIDRVEQPLGIRTIAIDADTDRKSTRLNSSHSCASRMPSSA